MHVLRSQGKSLQELCVKHEDLYNSEKISSFSYLVKFEESSFSWLPTGLLTRSFACGIQLHSPWQYHLLIQLKKSGCFRFKFFCFILALLRKTEETQNTVKLCVHCSFVWNHQIQSKHPKIKLRFKTIHNKVHSMEPEVKWSTRILRQMIEQLQLEAVFAWLSTLGGAHSALGDYFSQNAKVAWDLSLKQLFVAIKIGDPALAAHCKLFMSISLMQRGYFSAASKIIRAVSRSIKHDKRLQERRLMNCCRAARVRLKYIRQERNGVLM